MTTNLLQATTTGVMTVVISNGNIDVSSTELIALTGGQQSLIEQVRDALAKRHGIYGMTNPMPTIMAMDVAGKENLLVDHLMCTAFITPTNEAELESHFATRNDFISGQITEQDFVAYLDAALMREFQEVMQSNGQ